jgi:hypothetical protein
VGLIPDLFDIAVVPVEAVLDDDVDEEIEKAADLASWKLSAGGALLDEEGELLEGELGAGGVNTGDGAGVARVDVAEVIEGFLASQLGEEDSVGSQAQTTLEELSRGDFGESLIALGIEETDMVGVSVEDELVGVLDGDEALVGGDLADEGLGAGGLAGAGGAGDEDVLSSADGEAHEILVATALEEREKGLLGIVE